MFFSYVFVIYCLYMCFVIFVIVLSIYRQGEIREQEKGQEH